MAEPISIGVRSVKEVGTPAEVWSATWRFDPKAAVKDWCGRARSAREAGRVAEHHELLGWWFLTGIEVEPVTDEVRAWALFVLGRELCQALAGARKVTRKRAIDCLTASLAVFTQTDYPEYWADTQDLLGIAWSELPGGESGEHSRQAIVCFEAALRVRTEADLPHDWAATQYNLGNAYESARGPDRGENLRRSIACYEAALQVQTQSGTPREWAATQNNLGLAYSSAAKVGELEPNLRRAIDCYEAATRVYTPEHYPRDWAMAQANLGNAWDGLGDLAAARDCWERAHRGFRAAGDEAEALRMTDWLAERSTDKAS
jgi:tetratricopeptide (TPR) repeat protein